MKVTYAEQLIFYIGYHICRIPQRRGERERDRKKLKIFSCSSYIILVESSFILFQLALNQEQEIKNNLYMHQLRYRMQMEKRKYRVKVSRINLELWKESVTPLTSFSDKETSRHHPPLETLQQLLPQLYQQYHQLLCLLNQVQNNVSEQKHFLVSSSHNYHQKTARLIFNA